MGGHEVNWNHDDIHYYQKYESEDTIKFPFGTSASFSVL